MITVRTTPLYLEEKLAEKLGLTRDDLRFLRRTLLQKRSEWSNLERQIVVTQPGLDKVIAHLRTSTRFTLALEIDFADCRRSGTLEKKEGANGLTELTVKRLQINPKLLIATDPDGLDVKVRVRSNANFRPRMKLHARLLQPGIYQHEGRCPRFPNRY